MFVRRHRVGLCVECKPKLKDSTDMNAKISAQYALFTLEFSHASPSTNENVVAPVACTSRVKVFLKNSLDGLMESKEEENE